VTSFSQGHATSLLSQDMLIIICTFTLSTASQLCQDNASTHPPSFVIYSCYLACTMTSNHTCALESESGKLELTPRINAHVRQAPPPPESSSAASVDPAHAAGHRWPCCFAFCFSSRRSRMRYWTGMACDVESDGMAVFLCFVRPGR
jgi:hypothetical protein